MVNKPSNDYFLKHGTKNTLQILVRLYFWDITVLHIHDVLSAVPAVLLKPASYCPSGLTPYFLAMDQLPHSHCMKSPELLGWLHELSCGIHHTESSII